MGGCPLEVQMDRREFLKGVAVAATALALPVPLRLVHGGLEPAPMPVQRNDATWITYYEPVVLYARDRAECSSPEMYERLVGMKWEQARQRMRHRMTTDGREHRYDSSEHKMHGPVSWPGFGREGGVQGDVLILTQTVRV